MKKKLSRYAVTESRLQNIEKFLYATHLRHHLDLGRRLSRIEEYIFNTGEVINVAKMKEKPGKGKKKGC